ncbi:MAG: hypothetical protein QOF89_992 [Acidobacteriota bacterium]|nr:hypothetical protein [Acidobacteriota bacterium]
MKPRTRNILIVIACAILLILGGGYIALRMMWNSMTRTETDPGEYSAVLKQWSASGLVSQFPREISSRARHVRFSAFPGFMQGGSHIQLRMQLPADEIRRLRTNCAGQRRVLSRSAGSTTTRMIRKTLSRRRRCFTPPMSWPRRASSRRTTLCMCSTKSTTVAVAVRLGTTAKPQAPPSRLLPVRWCTGQSRGERAGMQRRVEHSVAAP